MEMGKTWLSGAGALSPSGISFFFPLTNKYYIALVVGGGGFHDNCDLISQEILPLFRTLTYEAERTLDLPRRLSRQGTSPKVSLAT